MQENFLHYLWRTRRFDHYHLTTTDGDPLDILDFGVYNRHDAGADFQNAKIRLDGLTWHGTVEMHLKASDWHVHKHDHDAAYNNVILHVVYDNDQAIKNKEGGHLPCVELKNHIPQGIFQQYWGLLHNEHWIPCQHHFYKVAEMTKTLWLERLLVERLERKATTVAQLLDINKGDWEETFWQFLSRYFGGKINGEPMEMVAQRLPHLVLAKHKNQLRQIEALLFGQAGFLDKNFEDNYPQQLKKEYDFLKHKHHLPPSVSATAWKFSRMRPPSFPTIRLAQLAQLIHQSSHLFSKIIDNQQISDYADLFKVELSGYWQDHFQFDTPSVSSRKKLGEDTIEMLLVNVVAPFLFVYGKLRGEDSYKTRAFELLEKLSPEKNSIVEGWQKLGISPESAATTQALIQLKTTYCDAKRCVECSVGDAIFKNSY
jgi:Protein of unknown function (DUF2851)